MGLVILNATVSSNLYFAMEAIVVADQEQHALHVKSITQAVTKAIERQQVNHQGTRSAEAYALIFLFLITPSNLIVGFIAVLQNYICVLLVSYEKKRGKKKKSYSLSGIHVNLLPENVSDLNLSFVAKRNLPYIFLFMLLLLLFFSFFYEKGR